MFDKLKIGYQLYTLEPHSDLVDISGDTDCETGVIRYDSSETGFRHVNTILHEVLHAVWDQVGLNATLTEDQQEQVVTGIANGLTMILADNPHVTIQRLKADDV